MAYLTITRIPIRFKILIKLKVKRANENNVVSKALNKGNLRPHQEIDKSKKRH